MPKPSCISRYLPPSRTANVALAIAEARTHLASRNYSAADRALKLALMQMDVPRAAVQAKQARINTRAVAVTERAGYELLAMTASGGIV